MAMILRGTPVPPRNWTAFLKHWPPNREPYTYRPVGLAATDPKAHGATIRFGTTCDIGEIQRVLSSHVRDLADRHLA